MNPIPYVVELTPDNPKKQLESIAIAIAVMYSAFDCFLMSSELTEERNCIVSHCGKYRFALWYYWDKQKLQEKDILVVMMCNPSTADHMTNDPTFEKVVKYAKRWGYGGILIVNASPLRATDPDIIGKNWGHSLLSGVNEYFLCHTISSGDALLGWGTHIPKALGDYLASLLYCGPHVLPPFDNLKMNTFESGIRKFYCLDINKDGGPKHPLYVRDDVAPKDYSIKIKRDPRFLLESLSIQRMKAIWAVCPHNTKSPLKVEMFLPINTL